MFLAGVAHGLLDLGEGRFGKKHLVIAPCIRLRPMALRNLLDACGSCFRAGRMLTESEHSAARED